jgi:glutaredoxin
MALIVYSSLWCPDCRTAKRFLDKHNISYTDIDIEATPGAADEVILTPASAPSRSSSSMAAGCSLIVRAKGFCTKKSVSFWE